MAGHPLKLQDSSIPSGNRLNQREKGKEGDTQQKTTANHPNPELPRTQKLEPRRLAGTIFSFSFERSQRVTGLCGQSLFKLPLENTALEVPRKARLQSTVLHTHPTASGAPRKVRHHCRQGPGKWLSRAYSPLSGHNQIKLYNRKTPKGPAPLQAWTR